MHGPSLDYTFCLPTGRLQPYTHTTITHRPSTLHRRHVLRNNLAATTTTTSPLLSYTHTTSTHHRHHRPATMAKKRLQLAHKLFSTMLSLLLHARRPTRPPPPHPAVLRRCAPPPAQATAATTLVVDVDSALLRSADPFPYFMLVALEAGGFLRGLLLLLLCPLVRCLGAAAGVRAMAAVAFCGLRAGRFRAGRAVLPKWFLEDLAAEGLEAVRRVRGTGATRVVGVTALPRVMVDAFLREYLGVDEVVGREMAVRWGFYTGFMEEEVPAAAEDKETGVVGFAGSLEFLERPLSWCCKEIFVVSAEEKSRWRPLSMDKYPKPVVFHDGRLAFRPTAADTLAMFAWLPLGAVLGAARLAVALTLPYRFSTPILAATGMSWRLKGARPALPAGGRGQLFVCNHRTLIDPVYVSVALDRQVRAVSYSLSRLSELISPIGRTVAADAGPARRRRRHGRGCSTPGTSSSSAPRAPRAASPTCCASARSSPSSATTSSPSASPSSAPCSTPPPPAGSSASTRSTTWPTPGCATPVQFLDRVDTSAVRAGAAPSTDMANLVQRKMGDALGYGCTMLTRKDKYLMLAGNDGIVRSSTDGAKSAAATDAAETKKKST
ncbi:hypothetical protein BS78_K072800 [Paspalum vaginatum]|uniref:Glycerol-3-phosphate acyltransferase RAM2/GPAT1-8 HAD-like domain-containing protein n=1 Tax=Paspalum vaginatum TaxID=158149 RepID=A0A9W8CDP8_9POAL|nr:hypothetical protein BS78_K072800 [Paspalum vaginatum]